MSSKAREASRLLLVTAGYSNRIGEMEQSERFCECGLVDLVVACFDERGETLTAHRSRDAAVSRKFTYFSLTSVSDRGNVPDHVVSASRILRSSYSLEHVLSARSPSFDVYMSTRTKPSAT